MNLSEEESFQDIWESTGKNNPMRTNYNYKKKLFEKEIFKTLKNNIYDSQWMKCLLLELEETDGRLESKKADKLICEQFPYAIKPLQSNYFLFLIFSYYF